MTKCRILRYGGRNKAELGMILSALAPLAGEATDSISKFIQIKNQRNKLINGATNTLNNQIQANTNLLTPVYRCGGRKKAFIGAAVSTGLSLVGGLLSSNAQKKQLQKQQAEQDKINHNNQLISNSQADNAAINSFMSNYNPADYQPELIYRKGGNKKGVSARITDGGVGIPLGYNGLVLLRGATHEQRHGNKTGIGIKVGSKEIEAENNEVVQKKPNELRVFSAQPIFGNTSPAQAVERGANPNDVFAMQELYKNIYHLNDDGTVYRRGGRARQKWRREHNNRTSTKPNNTTTTNNTIKPNNTSFFKDIKTKLDNVGSRLKNIGSKAKNVVKPNVPSKISILRNVVKAKNVGRVLNKGLGRNMILLSPLIPEINPMRGEVSGPTNQQLAEALYRYAHLKVDGRIEASRKVNIPQGAKLYKYTYNKLPNGTVQRVAHYAIHNTNNTNNNVSNNTATKSKSNTRNTPRRRGGNTNTHTTSLPNITFNPVSVEQAGLYPVQINPTKGLGTHNRYTLNYDGTISNDTTYSNNSDYGVLYPNSLRVLDTRPTSVVIPNSNDTVNLRNSDYQTLSDNIASEENAVSNGNTQLMTYSEQGMRPRKELGSFVRPTYNTKGYKGSKKVRNKIAFFEGKDFAGQNKKFNGDAVGYVANDLANWWGSSWDNLNENQRDALVSYYYNRVPANFKKEWTPLRNKFANAKTEKEFNDSLNNMQRNINVGNLRGHKIRRAWERNLFGTVNYNDVVREPKVIVQNTPDVTSQNVVTNTIVPNVVSNVDPNIYTVYNENPYEQLMFEALSNKNRFGGRHKTRLGYFYRDTNGMLRNGSVRDYINNTPNGVQIADYSFGRKLSTPYINYLNSVANKGISINPNNTRNSSTKSSKFVYPKNDKETDALEKAAKRATRQDKWGMINKKSDNLGLITDNLGSLALAWFNANALKGIKAKYATPALQQEVAVPFDTRYRIGAQLAALERTRINNNKLISDNTVNSSVAQARMQENNTNATLAANQLWDTKANRETELRNVQAQNEQGVRSRNAQAFNNWSNQVASIRNAEQDANNEIAMARNQAWQVGLQGIGQAFSNWIAQGQQRYQDQQSQLAYMAAAGPSASARLLASGYGDSGLNYRLYRMAMANPKTEPIEPNASDYVNNPTGLAIARQSYDTANRNYKAWQEIPNLALSNIYNAYYKKRRNNLY